MKLKHQRIIEKAVIGINVEETDKSLLYRHGLCALSFSRGLFDNKVSPISSAYFENIIGVQVIGRICNNWVIETAGMMLQESIQVVNEDEAPDIPVIVIRFKFVGL